MLWPLERTPLLSEEYLALIREFSVRQMETAGRILAQVVPRGLRRADVVFVDGVSRRSHGPADLKRMDGPARQELARAWEAGRVGMRTAVRSASVVCRLNQDPPWPLRPGARTQRAVLEYLHERGDRLKSELLRDLGKNVSAPLKTLEERGLVVLEREEDPPAALHEEPDGFRSEAIPLGAEQQAAVDRLVPLLAETDPRMALVHGVTGSGKTNVYLELIRRCLDMGRNAMLLAPEVAIATQLERVARDRFPDRDIRLYHGYQPAGRRQKVFEAVAAAAGPQLIIGTRSALFLPVSSPGLIVLDEEHDGSFKQDEGLIYQAKEVAFCRNSLAGGTLVLGSATPDVKTYHAAREGRIVLTELHERVARRSLPEIELVDLKEHPAVDGPLARVCSSRLREALERGEQVIVMHNRRGYAPIIYCETCAEPARCPHCQVSLTYHKAREKVVCHYCGYSRFFPMICEKCKGSAFIPLGEGTEKLEEFLAGELPEGTSVLRLDRDTSRRKGRLDEILGDFAKGRAQVLVGTQMLSKGHDFPGVTLVVVVDGDLGLNLPDYRAAERSFQLLVQVAGRSGRGDKPGTVLIQTRNPAHYCWDFVRNNDYRGFFEREITMRRRLSYPPFSKVGLIRLSFAADWSGGLEAVNRFAEVVRRHGATNGVRVLGPAPAPLQMLKGRMRHHCLLKGDDWKTIRQVFGRVRETFAGQKRIRVSCDLDPVNML
jgi:primosomal protein N' (replication factor Y)